MMIFRHTDELAEITINTHIPDKWRFVDLETGDVWKWNSDRRKFLKADDRADTVRKILNMP